MDNGGSEPLATALVIWLFPESASIETWHDGLDNALRLSGLKDGLVPEEEIAKRRQMVLKLEGFQVAAACVTKDRAGFEHQAVLAVLKSGKETRHLLIHRQGLQSEEGATMSQYLKSKRADATANDRVESISERSAREKAHLAVKTKFKHGTATTPTLVDLHLACLATHRSQRDYNMITTNCYWWSDTVIGILEKVAGSDGYEVERKGSKLKRGETYDSEGLGDFGRKKDGTFHRIPLHWRDHDEIEDIHKEFIQLKENWVVSLPHFGRDDNLLPAHSPES